MNSDNILHKYLRHLRRIDTGAIVHIDAVELAFRLAIEELEESMAPADTVAQLGTANLRIMELQADLERLQTATNAEVAELRSQLAELDTDNAAMIRRNRELVDELHIVQNGTGLAIKNPPFVNGPEAQVNNSMWHGPDMLALLDDEATDWWIGCDAGRHTWRTVPKPVQLRMVRHVLSFGPETGDMTMREFDAIKPDWMPGSVSHTQTLKLSWSQLNDWSVELEATR
jgi:hypothetical protein